MPAWWFPEFRLCSHIEFLLASVFLFASVFSFAYSSTSLHQASNLHQPLQPQNFVVSMSTLFHAWQACCGRETRERPRLSGKYVALNASEIQSVQLPSQATATVYEGHCPESWLRQRVQKILAANPWIAGVLETRPQDGKLALWFPGQPQCDRVFQVVIVAKDTGFQHASQDCIVKVGSELTDSGEPVCRIAALIEPTHQRWTLQMSMSHVIADSHTFYAIYGMLDERARVWPMVIERVTFDPCTCLKAPLHWKWLFFTLCRLRWLLSPWPQRQNPVIKIRYVKDEWLQKQKVKHVAVDDAPFVSANDLLSSWFFSVTQPACGFIALNMRNRMVGLDEERAGVYTTMLFFYPEEYKRSANIRRAVTRLSPACMPDSSRQKPGPGSRCAAVTAWHMFYQDVNLPGCKELLHLPVTSVWNNFPTTQCPFALIFRPQKDRLAMCTVTGEELPEDPEGPLGEALGDAFKDLEVLDAL